MRIFDITGEGDEGGAGTLTVKETLSSGERKAISGSLAIPRTLNSITAKKIGASAFEGCSSIAAVVIPASVTTIEECAFSECTGLNSLHFPGSVLQWQSIRKEDDIFDENVSSIMCSDGWADVS